jgi:hypothetical protein
LVIHCIINYPVLRAPQVGERRFSLDVRGVTAATVSGMETCEDCDGLVEDEPGFKPLYRDERVNLGLYASDTAADVAAEVVATATMLVRLFEAIEPQQLDRIVQYGFPDPLPRSLLWMGQQAIHESEHHVAAITENLGVD